MGVYIDGWEWGIGFGGDGARRDASGMLMDAT